MSAGGSPDYVVTTRYDVEDGPARAKIGSLASTLSDFGGKAGAALDSIADTAINAALSIGAAGIGAALLGVKVGLVDVNAKLEETQIGFATIFDMQGVANFTDSMGLAKTLMEGIRKDAQILPGEFGDFVSMAKTLSAPLLQAGQSLDGVRNMTRDTVVTAAAMGIEFQQAAREMAMALGGRVGGHNVLATRMGITAETQINGKKFHDASNVERYDFLTNAMKKATDALPAFQASWAGVTSTMADGMKRFLGNATLPLFEKMKGAVNRLNGMLDSPAAAKMAEGIGNALGIGFDWALKKTEWIAEHWDEIRRKANEFATAIGDGFAKIEPTLERIGKALFEALKDPMKILKEFIALRVGAAALSFAPQLATLGVVAGAGGAGAAAGGAEAAAAEAAGIGGAGVALALVPLVGVVDNLTRSATDGNLVMQATASSSQDLWADIKTNGKGALDLLCKGFADLWAAVRPIVDIMGVGLLLVIDGLVIAIEGVSALFAGLAGAIRGFMEFLHLAQAKEGPKLDTSFKRDGLEMPALPSAAELAAASTPAKTAEEREWDQKMDLIFAKAKAAESASKSAHGSGKTNVTVNAPLTVLSDADPERLAKSVATHIESTLMHPRKSPGFSTYLSE